MKQGWHVIETTPYSRCASLSSGGPTTHKTFLMYRRAPDSQALNTLGVTDISLLMPSKGEVAPHTFCKVDKNLNTGMVQLLLVHHSANFWFWFFLDCALFIFCYLHIVFFFSISFVLCFYSFSFLSFSSSLPYFFCIFLYFCLLWFWLSCFWISVEYLFLNNSRLCVCMFALMCLFLYIIQWGPALYLCYKRAVVKANALVYEAGEWDFFVFVSLWL